MRVEIRTQQGDMRDLSCFEQSIFDIVYHPYSLGFVPDARAVFQQVARIIRTDGLYHFTCANPFSIGLSEKDWNGKGYTLKHPYIDGAEVTYEDQNWVYDRNIVDAPILSPKEYRHTLSTLVSGLVDSGFVLVHLMDHIDFGPDPNAEPGTWEHFVSVAPSWLSFLAAYRPR